MPRLPAFSTVSPKIPYVDFLSMFYFFLHFHFLLQVTGALYVIVCHCASVDRAAMLSLGPEAMLYQNHQVQFRGIFYPDPPSNMSLLIFYLSGFCIWRRLLESAAFTPTNGHYWDPIATHHTTGPKCVYFQLLHLYQKVKVKS